MAYTSIHTIRTNRAGRRAVSRRKMPTLSRTMKQRSSTSGSISKKYAVDGKPPTMLDLLEKSNKLKSKWNRLNVEHTAFLTKREMAKKYTRQVRNYINEEHNRREHEKYRQKKLTQQRKKDTWE